MDTKLSINITTINKTPYEKALCLMRELRESYIIEGYENHARLLVTPKVQEENIKKVNQPRMKKTLSWEDLKEGGNISGDSSTINSGNSSTINSGNSSESEEPYIKKYKMISPKETLTEQT
jgi:hypothetical protein